MSTNHTPNYSLCQWEAEDKVLRTEFNADNAKIDAAIKAVDRRVDGKASTTSVNSLKSTVDSLSQTVAGHTSSLSGKGNCQIYTTSYVGNGKYGSSNPCSFTFPLKPMVVLVVGLQGYQGIFLRDCGLHYAGRFGGNGNFVNLTWGSRSVQWYSDQSTTVQMNLTNTTYHLIALLQAD